MAPPIPGQPPIHTQTIESTWSDVKRKMKHLKGTSANMWPTYLFQYMFRKAHNGQNIFGNFWFTVGIQYPV